MSVAEALRWPISRVGKALRAGDFTSEQLTVAAIAAAERSQPRLNAFLEILAEAALAQARARDAEGARGAWRGPLHGVPLAHKDCFARAGRAMTVGSRVLDQQPSAFTATALQRLDEAGAIDLGPLALNEMVAGPTGQNPHYGDCRNSIDPAYISGGSSSGSGSAVGAGIVFGSLGSDTGGSIRLPGSVNGLFALKPTYGRVSRAGCFPRAISLDCVGPLARSAEDCALLLAAVAGKDEGDPSSAAAAVPDYAGLFAPGSDGAEGVARALGAKGSTASRLAILSLPIACDAQVQAAFARLCEAAAARHGPGPRLPVVGFDALEACYAMADVLSKVEAASLHGDWMRTRGERYSQAVYSRTEPGLHVPAVRYVEAIHARAAILRAFLDGPMRSADVLLCPTLPVPVPTREEADMEAAGKVFGVVAQLTPLTRPFNYLGLPVLTMPMGLDSNGLPLGAQLIGRPFGEARLLAVAHALSADLGWRHPLDAAGA